MLCALVMIHCVDVSFALVDGSVFESFLLNLNDSGPLYIAAAARCIDLSTALFSLLLSP